MLVRFELGNGKSVFVNPRYVASVVDCESHSKQSGKPCSYINYPDMGEEDRYFVVFGSSEEVATKLNAAEHPPAQAPTPDPHAHRRPLPPEPPVSVRRS